MTNLTAFYKKSDVLPKSIVEKHYIYLVDENRTVFQHAIPLSFFQKKILMAKVKLLVDMGFLIRHVDHTPFDSPVFLAAKQAAINIEWSIALSSLTQRGQECYNAQ